MRSKDTTNHTFVQYKFDHRYDHPPVGICLFRSLSYSDVDTQWFVQSQPQDFGDNNQLDKLMQNMTNLGPRPIKTFESQKEDELAVIFIVFTETLYQACPDPDPGMQRRNDE